MSGEANLIRTDRFAEPGWLLMLSALLLVLLIVGCDSVTEVELPPRPVRAVQAQLVGDLSRPGFDAKVVSERETPLAFQVGGRLSDRHINNGDKVKSGQRLLSLNRADFVLQVERFRAELKVAEAEQRAAKADLDRVQQLQGHQFVSPTDMDQAGNRYSASAGRSEAMAAQLATATRQLGYTNLPASYAGWISGLAVEQGQVIAAAESLGSLLSDRLEVEFGLPEQYIDRLQPGDRLAVRFWGCDHCSTLAGVREIDAVASQAAGTLAVRATLAEQDLQLRPGMTAWVELNAGFPADAVVMPQIAVVQKSGKAAVWIVETDPKNQQQVTQLRQVSLGAMVADQVLVTKGLVAGEWVVTAGQHLLADNHIVRILD
ncbi:MAG: efflux RND transporter periplasmic adaptor subunit [Immundisolibacteraceae bacterium]|nr:efflux RND transporter periplasmic adaptor subunit [Immundisolibacteraceae bacterium]